MENFIPTAEEFINRGLDDSGFELTGHQLNIIARNVREFTKLHLKAQAKAMLQEKENARINGYDFDSSEIMNAYPESNVK